MKRRNYLATITVLAALLCGVSSASAQTAPSLGAAQGFSVLGGSTVTNTGSTVVTGNLGLSPGTAVTGFPPGVLVSGQIYAANAVALNAQNALTTAYNNLVSQGCTANLTGQNLGGLTLTPGVYCFDTAAQLTGTLTLNGQGNAAAVFIFKIGSTLTTASASNVLLINSASPCNVFFQITSSATLGTSSHLEGNLLALTSITLTTGASISGRALARNGAVTLDTNAVTIQCAGAAPCPVIALAPATLPNGAIGTLYNQTVSGSGGAAPYVFSITAGALPTGLTLTSTGVVAGTPTTSGTFSVTIRGTDANGCFTELVYSITIPAVVCPVITLAPPTLPNGVVGTAYSQTITGSGGTGPYVFTITAGALPTGLTLTAAGLVAGTPTTTGTFSVTIRGTDANGCFASLVYSVTVTGAACPVITLAPPTLPNGIVGTAYSQTITGSGGTGPYVFTITAGALPTGLTLTAAGLVSGTPTTAGTFSVTIRGTDANGCFASLVYSITVTTPVPTLPEIFAVLLTMALLGMGWMQLRRRPARVSRT